MRTFACPAGKHGDPFFQSCKHDPIPLPRPASPRRSGGEVGVDDGELSLGRDGPDVDRFFRDKDLEELTRKTYDNMGLEVRDVLAKSDLYERGNEPTRLLSRRREGVPLRRAGSGERAA
jgi:hypothetical protein